MLGMADAWTRPPDGAASTADGATASKAEKERQRKERQRQRKVAEAEAALRAALAALDCDDAIRLENPIHHVEPTLAIKYLARCVNSHIAKSTFYTPVVVHLAHLMWPPQACLQTEGSDCIRMPSSETRSVVRRGGACGARCVRSRAGVQALQAAAAAAAKLAARSAALPPLLDLAHERVKVWPRPP
jgi:hypothetical protein